MQHLAGLPPFCRMPAPPLFGIMITSHTHRVFCQAHRTQNGTGTRFARPEGLHHSATVTSFTRHSNGRCYYLGVNAREENVAMQALLTALITWLSVNHGLPANYDLPAVRFATPKKIAFIRFGALGRRRVAAYGALRRGQRNSTVSVYEARRGNRAPVGWRATPASCPFSSTSWCAISRIFPVLPTPARRRERRSPTRRRNSGSAC